MSTWYVWIDAWYEKVQKECSDVVMMSGGDIEYVVFLKGDNIGS